MTLPIQGALYTTQEAFTLINQTTGAIITDPSIASGDFKISKDGGSFINLAALPAVSPSGSPAVYASYSAIEMTASVIEVWGVDTAGIWDDVFFSFQVPKASVETIDEIIGTTGVALSSDQMDKIADHVIRRNYSNVRASSGGDTINARSLMGSIATVVNRVSATVSPNNLTVFHEDDSTVFVTKVLTTAAEANLITDVDPP